MKVFICWSGNRSKMVAEALRQFLPDVIQRIDPFMSEADIEGGSRWSQRLLEELESTNFGIPCLTSESLTAPWLLFESGALGKSVQHGRVCPYLFGLEPADVKWPLAQFQMLKALEEGSLALVRAINSNSPEHRLEDEQLQRAFSRVWPDWEKALSGIPVEEPDSEPKRDTRDMVEEILSLLRPSTRPQVSSAAPKPIVVDCVGGSLNGERWIDDPRAPRDGPFNGVGILYLTKNGCIGARFWTITRTVEDLMSSSLLLDEREKALDELPPKDRAQVYEVVDRYEDDLVLYVKLRYDPEYKKPDKRCDPAQ
jgi:hypothetical protein